NGALYWRKLFTKVETTGVENVEGHECYKVVMTPKEGKPTTHYYDKKSGFLVKTATTRTTQMGDIPAEGFADDYRKEGGVIAPNKLTNKIVGQVLELTVQSLQFNADLPKDQFDLPEEIQALLKKAAQPAAKAAPASTPAAAAGDKGKLTIYM